MRAYSDSDIDAAVAEPLPAELIEVERPSAETVQEIRAAAARWAAYQANPTLEERDAAFDWHQAIEKLTPATLVDLCDVWLLVEAESES